MPALVRFLVCVAFAGLPALAAAAPRTIADCESIEAADAYNRCLASFGPPGRSLRLVSPAKLGSDTVETSKADGDPAASKRKQARAARKASRHASAPRRVIRATKMVFSVASDRPSER